MRGTSGDDGPGGLLRGNQVRRYTRPWSLPCMDEADLTTWKPRLVHGTRNRLVVARSFLTTSALVRVPRTKQTVQARFLHGAATARWAWQGKLNAPSKARCEYILRAPESVTTATPLILHRTGRVDSRVRDRGGRLSSSQRSQRLAHEPCGGGG
jgi:hypothetical protein